MIELDSIYAAIRDNGFSDQQWAEARGVWFDNAEKEIEAEYGSMIAQGAEAKVYYQNGDTSVIKLRTSIYICQSASIVS